MNNDFNKYELDIELSPEETAAIDRLMKSVADADDREVDYDAMLDSIKRRAAGEGIFVFPAKKKTKKEGLLKRFAMGAATAAAVFAVGLFAMTMINKLSADKDQSESPAVDAYVSESASGVKRTSRPTNNTAADTKAPSAITDTKHTEPVLEPVSTQSPEALPATQEPAPVELPDVSVLPTSFPMRGGSAGYLDLDPFEEEPLTASDLVPVSLPDCMNLRTDTGTPGDTSNLSAIAEGESDGQEYSYTCTVVHDLDVDLNVGMAMYKYDETSGHITCIWRISEDSFLVVEFDGFDLESAEEMLFSLVNESSRVELSPAA